AAIRMTEARHCIVEGCAFRYHAPFPFAWGEGDNAASAGILVAGAGNTIRNCSISHAWGGGISVNGPRCVIENNWLEDLTWAATSTPISFTNADVIVRHNSIQRCAGTGIIGAQAGSTLVKRPQILFNDIGDTGFFLQDSGQSAIYVANGDAPSEERSLEGGVIAYNWIGRIHVPVANGRGFGIYVDDGTDHVTIHHNLINAGGEINSAIFLHYNGHRDDDIGVYNNTLWGYREYAVHFAGNWDGCGGGTVNCRVENNLSEKGGYRSKDPIANTSFAHNGADAPPSEFVNPAGGDFRLRPGAQAVDKGVMIPGVTDAVRDGKPDLGAYELGSQWRAGATPIPMISAVHTERKQTASGKGRKP
ncbi:MAG: hypothetical protein C4321_04230, partial [Chloroflexota bacterium]